LVVDDVGDDDSVEDGTVVERAWYEAYGKATLAGADGTAYGVQSSQWGNEHLFTGQRHCPETRTSGNFGLYYYKNRYYDPGLGRFITRDPAGYVEATAAHSYCSGCPTTRIDPIGLTETTVTTWSIQESQAKVYRSHDDPDDPSSSILQTAVVALQPTGTLEECVTASLYGKLIAVDNTVTFRIVTSVAYLWVDGSNHPAFHNDNIKLVRVLTCGCNSATGTWSCASTREGSVDGEYSYIREVVLRWTTKVAGESSELRIEYDVEYGVGVAITTGAQSGAQTSSSTSSSATENATSRGTAGLKIGAVEVGGSREKGTSESSTVTGGVTTNINVSVTTQRNGGRKWVRSFDETIQCKKRTETVKEPD